MTDVATVAAKSRPPVPTKPLPEAEAPGHGHGNGQFWPLALGSIGVVFGDIGTSPIYAFKLALAQASAHGGVQIDAVLGVVSMALWALILVVTVKYVIFLMRIDNRGEGGGLSLTALAQAATGRRTVLIFLLGVTGASLFYGDAVITPAISVLSAVEGLKTAPALQSFVTPGVVIVTSLVILIGLFLAQSRGTGKVAGLFGPICVAWFVSIALVGLPHLIRQPGVLASINPAYAVGFLAHHGFIGFLVLGSVFLTVTGAEALYADMGHFGRWPIQAAWLFLVLPCLVLNYFGQGAFALSLVQAHGPTAIVDTDWFFQMAPEALRLPLVVLASAATVIASQAVITGAFSVTQQAMRLGFLPRMEVRRTSETAAGQIYLPQVNFMLLAGVVFLIAIFKSSAALGQAYGLAVTGAMAVDTSLAFIVVRRLWKWPLWLAILLVWPFLTLDLVFVSANSLKILSGAALPLILGAALFTVMATWARGGAILTRKMAKETPPLLEFLKVLNARPPHRVAGAAIYLTADPDRAPGALMHNLKHNKVLHQQNIILTVETAEVPRVDAAERIRLEPIDGDFQKLTLRYGYMETPDIPRALAGCRKLGLVIDLMSTSFFLGRKTVVPSPRKGLGRFQDRLFILLAKNAADPTDFFHIPPGRVLEMGTQVSV